MKDEIVSQIRQAFVDDLADVVQSFELVRTSMGDDDWLDNGVIKHTQTKTARGVFSNFGSREIDGETILRTDVKLIALQDEIDIQQGDVINGMSVIHVAKDPAGVAWFVQLRGV